MSAPIYRAVKGNAVGTIKLGWNFRMRKVWDQVPSGTCARRDLTAPAGPAGLERKTGGFGMKKELIALGAALALVGT